jgi:hypothetical protein
MKIFRKEQGILVIDWTAFKDLVVRELAVHAMGVLYLTVKIIDRFSKAPIKDIWVYKTKTKNYHVRIIKDMSWDSPLILARKKGLLKEWVCIEKSSIPEFLAKDIFSETCSDKKRQRLVSKLMELKAFW